MSRREDRTHAFCLIYMLSFRIGRETEKLMADYFEHSVDFAEDDETVINTEHVDREFVRELFYGVAEHQNEIDEVIGKHAKNWQVTRINSVDLALIRLAVFEIMFSTDTPRSVAAYEAVEIAKIYSTDESPGFINGILDSIAPKPREPKPAQKPAEAE